jgi:hypothetical protein
MSQCSIGNIIQPSSASHAQSMTDVSTFLELILELMDAYGNQKATSKSLQSEKYGSQTTSSNYQPRSNTFNGI